MPVTKEGDCPWCGKKNTTLYLKVGCDYKDLTLYMEFLCAECCNKIDELRKLNKSEDE